MLEEYSDDVRICKYCGTVETPDVKPDSCHNYGDYYHNYICGRQLKSMLSQLSFSVLSPETIQMAKDRLEKERLQTEKFAEIQREKDLAQYFELQKKLGMW